jgi:single-strand DNA-binding protein
MWNYIQLIGRLTRDPINKSFGSESNLATFSIAQNRKLKGQDVANYFDCKGWNKVSERASKLKKGDMVVVQGRLEQETWDDNNGNKRSKHVVNVQSILVIPSRNQDDDPSIGYETQVSYNDVPDGEPIF